MDGLTNLEEDTSTPLPAVTVDLNSEVSRLEFGLTYLNKKADKHINTELCFLSDCLVALTRYVVKFEEVLFQINHYLANQAETLSKLNQDTILTRLGCFSTANSHYSTL